MQNLEVAAILIAMETKIHNLTNLTNINLDTEELKKLNSLEVFSSITCNWLSDLSIFLLKDPIDLTRLLIGSLMITSGCAIVSSS